MKQEVDVIIVGMGLAGSVLALKLLKEKKTFVVVNQFGITKSSEVAAGIYNPILAKRFKLSQNAAEIYPFVAENYLNFEKLLSVQFLHQTPIYYVIESKEAFNNWCILAENETFQAFVEIVDNDSRFKSFEIPFGLLKVKHSGWVNIPVLLNALKHELQSNGQYLDEEFVIQDLKIDKKVSYNNIEANQIVFCEGVGIKNNPLTQHIELKPAKGEVLIVENKDAFNDFIIQQGVFMVNIDNNKYKIGSNFEWKQLDYTVNESVKDELLQKLLKFFPKEVIVKNHEAGIRPSSLDRKPIIGALKKHDNIFVFNGLGSKGVALAPHYCNMLFDAMFQQSEIEPSVCVSRFEEKKKTI